jgi:ribosome maturation factor RimP
MKRRLVIAGAGLLALSVPLAAGAASAERQWVRGKVTAVSSDSLTVSADGKDMKFAIDKDTTIIARGGGTKMREAHRKGQEGVKVTDVVKVGEGVEVHYHDMGGKLHAAEVRAGVAAPGGKSKSAEHSGKSVTGKVKSVEGANLTVSADGKDWTFAVDDKTRIIGSGASTLTRKRKAAGAATYLKDFVHSDDQVTVSYHEMGGTMHAGEVRVLTGRAVMK